MAGTKSASVTYSKGRVRADTRKLDASQKATQAQLDDLSARIIAQFGTTRGDLLMHGASGIVKLQPGTSGHFLKSNGAGADLSYASAGDLQNNYFQSNANTAISAVIPVDGSKPQVSEGTEFWSESITPRSASSILEFNALIQGICNASNITVTVALFTSASADAVAANTNFIFNTSHGQLHLSFRLASWGLSARTVSLRVGVNTGVFTLNGVATSSDLGDIMFSSLKWREYLQPA